jgi:hypothetical protein
MKNQYDKIKIISIASIAIISCLCSLDLYLSKNIKINQDDTSHIRKLPFQTDTFHEALKHKINLGMTKLDVDAHKLEIKIFCRSNDNLTMVMNSKILTVNLNGVIEKLQKPVENKMTTIVWFFVRFIEIAKLMPVSVDIEKNEKGLIIDSTIIDEKDFKMLLISLIELEQDNFDANQVQEDLSKKTNEL